MLQIYRNIRMYMYVREITILLISFSSSKITRLKSPLSFHSLSLSNPSSSPFLIIFLVWRSRFSLLSCFYFTVFNRICWHIFYKNCYIITKSFIQNLYLINLILFYPFILLRSLQCLLPSSFSKGLFPLHPTFLIFFYFFLFSPRPSLSPTHLEIFFLFHNTHYVLNRQLRFQFLTS